MTSLNLSSTSYLVNPASSLAIPKQTGDIDRYDTSESFIALSEGDTGLSYRVIKDEEPVGV